MHKTLKTYSLLALLCLSLTAAAQAKRPYLMEIGVQAGCGYYVGEATPHIFTNPREAYGMQLRYKFTQRWAVHVSGMAQRITGNEYEFVSGQQSRRLDSKWQNLLINLDVAAEFNFFRFGDATKYDKRIKPYTPYIFMGIGVGIYGAEGYKNANFDKAMAYIPIGIGFKWRFHERCGLNIAWQHNIYMSDDLENRTYFNDRTGQNGSNWMNCDLTGMVTVGLVFEFIPSPKKCRICNTE